VLSVVLPNQFIGKCQLQKIMTILVFAQKSLFDGDGDGYGESDGDGDGESDGEKG
jgi:hypothetical protein